MSIYEHFDNHSDLYTETARINPRQVDFEYHGSVENDDDADYIPIVSGEVIA